jgi:hypothetical protein
MQSVSGNFPEKFWMAEHLGYGGSGPNSDRRLSASIEARTRLCWLLLILCWHCSCIFLAKWPGTDNF